MEEPTKKSREQVLKERYGAFANLQTERSDKQPPEGRPTTGRVYLSMPPIDPFNPRDTRIATGTPIERIAEYQKEEFLRREALGKKPHPSIDKLAELPTDHPYRVAWALAQQQIAMTPQATKPQVLPGLIVLLELIILGVILYLIFH